MSPDRKFNNAVRVSGLSTSAEFIDPRYYEFSRSSGLPYGAFDSPPRWRRMQRGVLGTLLVTGTLLAILFA